MANKPLNTALLDRAIIFAVKAHSGTERRGKGYPYIVHPLEAVEIVATMTSDQELLAAAALHDTVEDTDVTVDQIRAKFGDRVAALVAAETDSLPIVAFEAQSAEGGISRRAEMEEQCDDRKAPADSEAKAACPSGQLRSSGGIEDELASASWHSRKQAAIDRLAKASHDAKIVALGDKLSNMRAIARDYSVKGDELWNLFHAKDRRDHEWHYRGLADALREMEDTFAYKEFENLINQVFA